MARQGPAAEKGITEMIGRDDDNSQTVRPETPTAPPAEDLSPTTQGSADVRGGYQSGGHGHLTEDAPGGGH